MNHPIYIAYIACGCDNFHYGQSIYDDTVLDAHPYYHHNNLCRAYIEAANSIRRYCPEAKAWHQRKMKCSKQIGATKALAGKICKACYFIMKDQVEFVIRAIYCVVWTAVCLEMIWGLSPLF